MCILYFCQHEGVLAAYTPDTEVAFRQEEELLSMAEAEGHASRVCDIIGLRFLTFQLYMLVL